MKRFSWRGLARWLHRDLGYLFFGLTIAYSVSGVALNHLRDWNPNYSVSRTEASVDAVAPENSFTKEDARALLKKVGVEAPYQSHYTPAEGQIKIFFQGGNAVLEKSSGKVVVESLKRRPILNTFNKLHYNPGVWWTWFADTFSIGLFILAVTGIFMIKGRHGITRRGGVLVLIGVAVPGIFVFLYLN